jgi:hypothetical protein
VTKFLGKYGATLQPVIDDSLALAAGLLRRMGIRVQLCLAALIKVLRGGST